MRTIRVEKYQFFDKNPIVNVRNENAYPGCDGCVMYEVYDDAADKYYFFMQPFARGGPGFRADSTEEERKNNRANVWGWNGDRDKPTLTPSFLCDNQGIRVHLNLTNGQIVLHGDSTIDKIETPEPV